MTKARIFYWLSMYQFIDLQPGLRGPARSDFTDRYRYSMDEVLLPRTFSWLFAYNDFPLHGWVIGAFVGECSFFGEGK